VIPNNWYAILPSKAVKANKIVSVKRLNLPLALFRDKAGKLGCVVDQCTHRGAALSLGTVNDTCIKCPFHGLEFNKSGECTLIPANGKASTEDISRYHVKSYLVREANGIIYIWYGEEKNVTEILPFFNDFVDNTYAYSEMQDHWNSHYSRSIENQLDVVHLPFVHYNTIGFGNKTIVNGPKCEFTEQTLRTSADNDVDNGGAPKPSAECTISDKIFLNFRFPNLWMNHISEKVKVIIYFAPVDDENTILYIRFYCKISKIRFINSFIAFIGKFANRIIERQDKRIVITQKPKASALKSGEKLLAGDGPIVLYRILREKMKNADHNPL
jgi:phenylpropionate dioxygenase-like ring-hydroxylating dioxygenase large terminal subunit